MGIRSRLATRWARTTGVGQQIFDEGWDKGFRDHAADLEEADDMEDTYQWVRDIQDAHPIPTPDEIARKVLPALNIEHGEPVSINMGYFHDIEDAWGD